MVLYLFKIAKPLSFLKPLGNTPKAFGSIAMGGAGVEHPRVEHPFQGNSLGVTPRPW